MTLEYTHECNDCGDPPKRDECYCKHCYEQYAENAYTDGKAEGRKEGYDEGYAQAIKDQTNAPI